MSRLNQVREEMRLTKDPAAQRSDRAPGADISRKLQKIIADIHECGHASVTRLTVLKKWFEIPDRVPFFGVSIAKQTLKQVGKATTTSWSPILKKMIALASVETQHAKVGTQLQMEVTIEAARLKTNVKVVPMPFFNPARKTATPV